ncbi:MAG: primosomal protein N' [Pirellulales bacterium]|nr:primosomal protein N' [Pirellulales bacterium]
MSQKQHTLFDTQPEPWEQDDQSEQPVASVVLLQGPSQQFDYRVPDALCGRVEPGCRLRVPLGKGNRLVTGYCVRVEYRPAGSRRLKPISELIDHRSLLSPAMLRLTEWIADRYLCDWARVLETVVPAGVRGKAGSRLTTLLSIAPEKADRWPTMKLPAKQAAVMKALARSAQPPTPAELARRAHCTQAPVTSLRRKGLIRSQTVRQQQQQSVEPATVCQPHLVLNADQRRALDAILATLNSRQHKTVLIHGVTGSGKTEVYIQAIQEVIHFGRQAIVLVPEISLTPQTVERFRSRFGRVAVLHSHLSDVERHGHWQQIAAGEVPVVVGARSAIFAPTPRLGLIVLDEEHESSFKQETAPRYHAREVAIARAAAEEVPLILGSATPSLESWNRAQTGHYALVEMPRRVLGRALPMVGTIDLRADQRRSSRPPGAVSRQMHGAMRAALDEGGQVILLLNRRGFSTHIQCPACGHVLRCPDCDIALTHHRTRQIALCHYCDHEVPAPTACPLCDFAGIRYSGLGTQRLEAEIRTRFPGVPCLRMDTDTMQGRGSHERALAAFRSGKVRILLGTQMIAKGLDFPDVTLVGVVNADTALHLPDFRAAERTFHLVTQVAGRTGRGDKGGRVLVQTFDPDHPAIQAAVRHDYAAFAAGELPIRQMLRYPPFTAMVRLVVRGPREQVAGEFAAEMAERLRAALADPELAARVLGPAPAPFARLRGKYRFQIQAQAPDDEQLRRCVRQATTGLSAPDDVQWIVDVDPLDML